VHSASRPPSATAPLSLHDALPSSVAGEDRYCRHFGRDAAPDGDLAAALHAGPPTRPDRQPLVADARLADRHLALQRPDFSLELRSEEHTSELQSRENLVCRLLLEK